MLWCDLTDLFSDPYRGSEMHAVWYSAAWFEDHFRAFAAFVDGK